MDQVSRNSVQRRRSLQWVYDISSCGRLHFYSAQTFAPYDTSTRQLGMGAGNRTGSNEFWLQQSPRLPDVASFQNVSPPIHVDRSQSPEGGPEPVDVRFVPSLYYQSLPPAQVNSCATQLCLFTSFCRAQFSGNCPPQATRPCPTFTYNPIINLPTTQSREQ